MMGGDAVFAVVTAELGQEAHRRLGSLRHELPEHPVHGLAERGALVVQFGREQITHVGVDGEPAGVEPADQLVGAGGVRVQGSVQHPHGVTVLEAHGRDLRLAGYRP